METREKRQVGVEGADTMRLVKISLFMLIVVLFGVWITSAQSTVTITGTVQQLTTDPLGQLDPAISGDLVVYTDQRNGNDDVYFVNVVTGVETQVTTATSAQRLNDVSGKRIVYTDLTQPGRRIILYNATTGATSVVGSGILDQNPRIDREIVAFERGLGSAADVYAVNLAANTEIPV